MVERERGRGVFGARLLRGVLRLDASVEEFRFK